MSTKDLRISTGEGIWRTTMTMIWAPLHLKINFHKNTVFQNMHFLHTYKNSNSTISGI